MGMHLKIKYLLIPVTLLLTLILGVGCVPAPNFTFSSASLPIANKSSSDILTPNNTYTPAIADIISKARPSVVAIDAELATYDISGHPITEQVAGSGWILNEDGRFIVTNSHVLEGAKSVTVTLGNGQTYTAKTIRTDPINDLAVIDIGIGNLNGITMGDSSKMRVGDQVIAIGNALGEGINATQGTIIATHSTFTVNTRETLYNMLETDAPIVHGYSGGPLINMDGEVIGITTGACLTWAGIEIMGYAISSSVAGPIIQRLR